MKDYITHEPGDTTTSELKRMCEDIARDLGNYDKWAKQYAEDHELSAEDKEALNGWNWLDDVLDIYFTVNRSREYLGAEVLVAFGGPNIWVNFNTHEVEGYWGSDKIAIPFRDGIGVKDALNEIWDGGY